MLKHIASLILLLCLIINSKTCNSETEKTVTNIINIADIDIKGNTVFSDRELKEAIGFLPNPLSLEDLLKIRTKITDYYVARGYINSGAYLPPQTLNGKAIIIEVVEGKISEIEILTNNYTKKSFLLNRIPLKGEIFNINLLEKYLNQLQNEPFVSKVNAELTNLDVGKTNLAIEIEEVPRLNRQFSFSNSYASSIGSYGINADLGYYLLGFGDRIEVSMTKTEGLERYSASYSAILNRNNTNFFAGYTNAESVLIEDEVKELDITGDFQLFQIGLNQPFKLSNRSQVELGIELKSVNSETFILEDFSFAFIKGLDNGVTDLTELTLKQSYSFKSNNNALFINSFFNIGVDLFDPTISEQGRDSLYWNWQLKAGDLLEIAPKLALYSQLNLQLTPDQLPPISQFSLGGVGSVRGYGQNFVLGDNGIFLSTEAQYLTYKSSNSQLKLLAFLEGGTVWSNQIERDDLEDLLSLGLGIEYSIRALNIRLEHGIPLIERESDIKDTKSSNRTTLSIIYSQ